MSAEELRAQIRATPFRPFLLNVADGRRIPVGARDYILVSPTGRTAHVYQRDESYDIVDMLLVTGLSFDVPTAESRSNGSHPDAGQP